MIWDQEQPCATCPYRRSTKLSLWSEAKFIDLQRNDEVPLDSSVYACHSSAKLPEAERRPCAGWLLDQKRRNLPSIPEEVGGEVWLPKSVLVSVDGEAPEEDWRGDDWGSREAPVELEVKRWWWQKQSLPEP